MVVFLMMVFIQSTKNTLKTISEDANGAPIYAHPRNNFKDDFKTKDITTQANDLKHFAIKVIDLPGNGGASVLVYSEINELERTEIEVMEYQNFTELYSWFTIPAALLSLTFLVTTRGIFGKLL